MGARRRHYTVWFRRTNTLLVSGTAQECADALGFTLHSFYSMVSRVTSGKNDRYDVTIEDQKEDSKC